MIHEEGVEVHFFPFNFYRKRVQWSDIQSIEVRKYNPIGEFGGLDWTAEFISIF